jgi:hypothetical protein
MKFNKLEILIITLALRKIITEDHCSILCDPWSPSENDKFPFVAQGNKNRSFKMRWIKEFHTSGGGFCRMCVLFRDDIVRSQVCARPQP